MTSTLHPHYRHLLRDHRRRLDAASSSASSSAGSFDAAASTTTTTTTRATSVAMELSKSPPISIPTGGASPRPTSSSSSSSSSSDLSMRSCDSRQSYFTALGGAGRSCAFPSWPDRVALQAPAEHEPNGYITDAELFGDDIPPYGHLARHDEPAVEDPADELEVIVSPRVRVRTRPPVLATPAQPDPAVRRRVSSTSAAAAAASSSERRRRRARSQQTSAPSPSASKPAPRVGD